MPELLPFPMKMPNISKVTNLRQGSKATFPDPRPPNQGGWVYVSNSEGPYEGAGGAGAISFDKYGNVLEYKMILENTTSNCGGGQSPFNTWCL
jgi:hypothetical protein